MKRIIAILLILLAANLIAGAALSSQSSFAGITGPAGAVVSTPGTDVKKVEDKMADALAKMDSWKKALDEEKIEPVTGSTGQAESSSSPSPISTESNSTEVNSTEVNSTDANLTSANSTLQNSSIISPPGNSSFEGSSGQPGSDAGKVDGSDATVPSDQKIGSSSGGRFKGYYGMTAARHEIGKSGISSRMSLSGDFEMDKTIKFQDQGFD
jgi:hypothetical protein